MSAQEWTLTFQGALAGADQAQVTINSASVFGSPSITNIQATDANGAAGTSEVQEITLAHAGSEGSFTLTFGGQTTGPIEFGASATEVETALEALASIGSGNVAVTSSTGGQWTVTFQGALANQNVAALTAAVVQPSLSADTTTPGETINEVQRVGVSASTSLSGGTFTLSFGGQTTSGIAYNASAATVQTALEGLSSIGSGNISVSKTQNTMNAQEWTLTFQGSLAGANQSQVTINSAGVSGMMSVSSIQATDTHGSAANEVQVVTLANATQGTFTLSFGGHTTDDLSYTASNSTVESALESLASIGAGNVSVTGSSGGPWTVTFQGALASTNVAPITGTASSIPEIDIIQTISTEFDAASQLLSVSDPDSAYAFVYDDLGRMLSSTADLNGFSASIVMAQTFDISSNRTKLAATIGTTADFVNDYAFDFLDRMTRIERHGVGGGNTVAPTRIDLAYLADSQFDAIARYTDLAGEDLAVNTAYAYDLLGRLANLDHAQGATALAGYAFTYDASSRIETIDSLIDGLTTYSYDTTSQLVAADFATQSDETHAWDANGNPDEVSAVIGPNNQVLSDGTYNYQYDGEGNRTRRTKISDGSYTEYLWDHRNRLIAVIDKDAEGNITQEVHYGYDFANRWIFRSLDDDGAGANSATSQWFAFDGNQVVLSFDDDEATAPEHRYLNGPQVDQYFTDENAENDLLFLLGDHLGTIRDTAMVDALTGDTELKNHTIYGSFHARQSDTALAFASFIGETGRPHDFATGNDNHLNRWLDGWLKRWMSEDPIGFAGGQENLRTYVDNNPLSYTDPSGLTSTLQGCLQSPAALAICIQQGCINKAEVAKHLMKQGQGGVVKLLKKWGGEVVKGGKGSHVKVVLAGETFIVAEPVSIGVAYQILNKILSM